MLLYFREMHAPTWISLFMNPFYFARKGLYKYVKELASNIKGRTLDIGCGSKPYQDLYKSTKYPLTLKTYNFFSPWGARGGI